MKAVANMANPAWWATNLATNALDIGRAVYIAFEDYSEKKYEDFGVQIGTVLADILPLLQGGTDCHKDCKCHDGKPAYSGGGK